jgi:predicted phosphoribosyltransferase
MTDKIIFNNRKHASKLLVEKLKEGDFTADFIAAIPRGGVPIGIGISEELGIPLKLLFVRKLGHPFNPEYAIGAVSETGLFINEGNNYGHEFLKESIKKERERISEMKKLFDNTLGSLDVKDKSILLTDDGIATGTCMMLAIRELHELGAKKITIAVPVCPYNTAKKLQKEPVRLIALHLPIGFLGIGAYYKDFEQLSDDQVIEFMSMSSI